LTCWLNPTNPQTRGIRPAEIRRLFPDCKYHFERITLTPPGATFVGFGFVPGRIAHFQYPLPGSDPTFALSETTGIIGETL
jgi:hypothetical protein